CSAALKSEDPVHPPVGEAGVLRGLAVEAHGDEALADEPAHRRPVLEVGVVRYDPEGFEQEACQREEEEAPEEGPVTERVASWHGAQRLGGLGGAPAREGGAPPG